MVSAIRSVSILSTIPGHSTQNLNCRFTAYTWGGVWNFLGWCTALTGGTRGRLEGTAAAEGLKRAEAAAAVWCPGGSEGGSSGRGAG